MTNQTLRCRLPAFRASSRTSFGAPIALCNSAVCRCLLFVRRVTRWSPEPVYASPARLLRNDAALLRVWHYGSQEATTVGHRRMVRGGV